MLLHDRTKSYENGNIKMIKNEFSQRFSTAMAEGKNIGQIILRCSGKDGCSWIFFC